MGCVEEGRRVDGEGVGVGTSAVARAKVGPSRSRASRSDTAPAEGDIFTKALDKTKFLKCRNYVLTSA